jgi:hypothetical protein
MFGDEWFYLAYNFKKKKKKTITCIFNSCSFTYYITLLFSTVKHQQKNSSVYGGHIKTMIFPLQKGMDVFFFLKCPISFSKIPVILELYEDK